MHTMYVSWFFILIQWTFPSSEGHVPMPTVTNGSSVANNQVPSNGQASTIVHFLDTVPEGGVDPGTSNHEAAQPLGLDF